MPRMSGRVAHQPAGVEFEVVAAPTARQWTPRGGVRARGAAVRPT
jgi:hypothetical protein